MRIEAFLQRLEQAQADLARDALEQPQGRDTFEYGRVVGIYAGLELAKTVLIDMVAEKERKDFNI
jgi:hypothetical protein